MRSTAVTFLSLRAGERLAPIVTGILEYYDPGNGLAWWEKEYR
jgi:hypothetical protein